MKRSVSTLVLVLLCSCSDASEGPEGSPSLPADDGGAAAETGGGNGGRDAGPGSTSDAQADAQSDGGTVSKKPLWGFVGSSDGKVRAFSVDESTGMWTLKTTSAAGTNPSFLAFDVKKSRAVAVDEVAGGMVRAFSVDFANGALTETNAKSAGGAGPTHVSLDPTGAWVFVANYTGGNMSVFPLDAQGKLGDASDTKASGNKSHWAGTNPSGTHVFVPALGANNVAQYTLNAQTGKLTANGTAGLPAGAGPRHLAFHPSEKFAYAVNELAISVTTFAFDKATGKLAAQQTLSALPAGQATQGVSGAEIFVHPNGKHVYASTRGYNAIAHFTVNDADGKLTYVASAVTGAPRPRSFGLDPEGAWLFAGNQDQDQVVGFRIDAQTGALSPAGVVADTKGPTFVGVLRAP
jgi:6-phosphogluconolactonase